MPASSHPQVASASRPARYAGWESFAVGRRPPRLRTRSTWLLVVSHLVLGLAIATTTGLLILQLREHTLTAARENLRSQALIMAEHADRVFESIDVLHTALIDRMPINEMHGPEDFRRAMSGLAAHEDLVGRMPLMPQLQALSVVDAEGTVINFSRYWPIPPINLADRDYYQALKADPGKLTFIGEPVHNRGTGSVTIYAARKVVAADGTLLGLLLGVLPQSYFEALYKAVATGPSIAISLFRQDGILLARYPHLEPQAGRSFAKGEIFRLLGVPGVSSAETTQVSQIEGVARLVAAHTLAHHPVLITVSNRIDTILAVWREQAIYLTVAAVMLELVLFGIGLLMLRQLRSQRMLSEARAARLSAEAELAMAQERERVERDQGLQNARFGAALSHMSQALCMFDASDRLIVANGRLAEVFGTSAASIVPGVSLDNLLAAAAEGAFPQQTDRTMLRDCIGRLQAMAARGSDIRELTDGRILVVNFAPVADSGWMVTLEDITARRLVEERINHMAHHDALTGLPNRVRFHEQLSEAVARSKRGEACAVLFLDLDHFKAVNDTLGHPVGDALLRQVTMRLCETVNDGDTVARLGGDEFAILQSSADQPIDATVLAIRLIDAISAPYEVETHEIIIGTSIGIAVVPADGEDPDQILRNADMALYRAKADGRGQYCFFEPDMDAKLQARRNLEMDLRNALNTGAFEMYYQPLMNIRSRSISGFEALLRWNHPERGLVSPAEFVPLAEEISLIIPIGTWTLYQACADAATWPGSPQVAVNLSPVQFESRMLVADVAGALEASGLAPHRLELEITETVMLKDTETVLSTLHRLKRLGVGIVMDDFGTGYSSLSYLRQFPFSKVKIDRSFIEGLGQGGESDAIVKAVIDLCEALGMTTTAEGVETEEQLQQLLRGHCTNAQGYLFSKPRPANQVAELCASLCQPQLEVV